MKKALKMLLVSLAALAVSFSAFAADPGISFGGWGRTVFSPIMSADGEDEEMVPKDSASWGGSSRIGFTIKGESDYIGVHGDFNFDGGGIGTHDQQKVWVKPAEVVTLEFGPTAWYDTLRGNGAYGSWNYLRFSGIEGEDNIFQRTEAKNGMLAHLDMGGLHVVAALSTNEDGNSEESIDAETGVVTTGNEQYTTALMVQRGQYGVGYDIAGIGQVRAQYIGKSYFAEDGKIEDVNTETNEGTIEYENYGVINAAFRIDQLVQGLYADLGFFMATDSDNTNGDLTTIAAYASYNMGSMTFHVLGNVELDKDWTSYDDDGNASEENGTAMKFGLGLDYALSSNFGINTDVRYHDENAVATSGVDSQIGFLVGAYKSFSNGKLSAGFEGTTHNFADELDKKEVDAFAWAVPVCAEYWF